MRIAISWSHGTGKTTLLDKYDTPLPKITEMSRDLINFLGQKPQDMSKQEKIQFQERLFDIQKIEEEAYKNFMSDRSVYDVLAYTYYACTETYKKMLVDVIDTHPWYDHVFYTPIEFELQDDGVRYTDLEFQKVIDEKIVQIMQFVGVEYKTLTGGVDERLQTMYDVLW